MNVEPAARWGNMQFFDLACGETVDFRGQSVRLLEVGGPECRVEVGGDAMWLPVARRSVPGVANGLGVFVADNAPAKALTTDSSCHGLLTRDALLGLFDPNRPLLPPGTGTFPISRDDGFEWTMEEDSHMFAYLGLRWDSEDEYRSHEGIDFNLHDARGLERHAILSACEGEVVWLSRPNEKETRVLVKSARFPRIFYIYVHLHTPTVRVAEGDRVGIGERLGFPWGDSIWGHLHFAVVQRDDTPSPEDRYTNLLNIFPACCELWHGSLDVPPRRHERGHFRFGLNRDVSGNVKRLDWFSELTGYGWRLGRWNAAARVEGFVYNPEGSGCARLPKTLFAGSPAQAVNPDDFYVFSVAVEPGRYTVTARVGDPHGPSWQRVSCNGTDCGTHELPEGETAWTDPQTVDASDGLLDLRLDLKDGQTPAALAELRFSPR